MGDEISESRKKELTDSMNKELLYGSYFPEFTEYLGLQLAHSVSCKTHGDKSIEQERTGSMLAIVSFDPRNEVEALMAAQLVTLHNSMMQCVGQAWATNRSMEACNLLLNQASKLSKSFTLMLDAYNKNRGKRQQKITVEHISIDNGSQAIIGDVDAAGRG